MSQCASGELVPGPLATDPTTTGASRAAVTQVARVPFSQIKQPFRCATPMPAAIHRTPSIINHQPARISALRVLSFMGRKLFCVPCFVVLGAGSVHLSGQTSFLRSVIYKLRRPSSRSGPQFHNSFKLRARSRSRFVLLARVRFSGSCSDRKFVLYGIARLASSGAPASGRVSARQLK